MIQTGNYFNWVHDNWPRQIDREQTDREPNNTD